jgi:hypothetical protein
MTLSRADIASYLDTQFSALAASIGQDPDPEEGYTPDIDLTLRKLGVARDDLVTATLGDGQEDAAWALSEFYALRRIYRQLGDRVTHTMGTTSYNFASQQASVKAMLDAAQKQVSALGYDVTGDVWSIGYMNNDTFEPAYIP